MVMTIIMTITMYMMMMAPSSTPRSGKEGERGDVGEEKNIRGSLQKVNNFLSEKKM